MRVNYKIEGMGIENSELIQSNSTIYSVDCFNLSEVSQ